MKQNDKGDHSNDNEDDEMLDSSIHDDEMRIETVKDDVLMRRVTDLKSSSNTKSLRNSLTMKYCKDTPKGDKNKGNKFYGMEVASPKKLTDKPTSLMTSN